MTRLNLVIFDTNLGYIKGLSNYLRINNGHEFQIVSITDNEYFVKFLQEDRKIDILLIGSELITKEISEKGVNTIIGLEASDKDKVSEFDSIKKYQPGNIIYKEIMDIYNKNNDNHDKNESEDKDKVIIKNTRVLSVYSPLGGIGKTSTAVSMSLHFNKLGNKVLYFNFEDSPTTELFFKQKENKEVPDIFQAAKDKTETFTEILLDSFYEDESGLYYLSPINNVLDIEKLSYKDLDYLIKKIKDINKFDYIIIDLSSKLNSLYQGILAASDKVIFLLGQDDISKIKTENILKHQEKMENYMFVINKYNKEYDTRIPKSVVIENKPIIQKIVIDEALSKGLTSKQYLAEDNIFSASVKEFVEKLIEMF